MAREAAKTATTKTEKLSFSSLKTNLVSMFGLIFSGGLITWMLVTDGMRDISFQFSENLFPVYMQEVGGLSLQQIGWVMSFFGLAMMLTTIPGGWLSDKAGERVGHLRAERHGVRPRHAFAVEPLTQRFATQQLHDHELQRRQTGELVDGDDAGMLVEQMVPPAFP